MVPGESDWPARTRIDPARRWAGTTYPRRSSPHPSTGWTQSCQIREAVIAEAARIEAETGRQMLPQIGPADEARR